MIDRTIDGPRLNQPPNAAAAVTWEDEEEEEVVEAPKEEEVKKPVDPSKLRPKQVKTIPSLANIQPI